MSRSLVLGTAGHIDHGKTALVRALTGIDTDRLKEEKERGITIDLGFAEWAGEGVHLGIVDVPGHEGFIRNMLAGATGMDVVLLVVAADEGVMPQTREHLSIVSLLGVDRLVVALTKADLVEPAWLELVRDEVRELLEGTPVADAEIVATSARTGQGLDELTGALERAAGSALDAEADDLVRLPVDRVFTVHGTGTVVTGTLWSGRLEVGRTVRLLPDGPEARVRGLQVHGQDVPEVRAGRRTAVALAGADVERTTIDRGHTLVGSPWPVTGMLTVRLRLLPDSRWIVEHGQRVRVHLGTAEVMARVVLLGGEEAVAPGGEAWAQLRLESPVVARAGERLVIRSYSPVTTIGGGTVVEPAAPKRSRLDATATGRLETLLLGDVAAVLAAALKEAGWAGLDRALLPVVTGFPPGAVEAALDDTLEGGAVEAGPTVFGPAVAEEAAAALEEAVDEHHRSHPLRPGTDVEALRSVLPDHAHPGLADTTLQRLVSAGRIAVDRDTVSRPGFTPHPDAGQEAVQERLAATYRAAGLAPPAVDELPDELRNDPDVWPLLKLLVHRGVLQPVTDDLFVSADALADAVERVRARLGGRTGLGPADFREALPVTRKHLMPLLAYLDRTGVTVRRPGGREVPAG